MLAVPSFAVMIEKLNKPTRCRPARRCEDRPRQNHGSARPARGSIRCIGRRSRFRRAFRHRVASHTFPSGSRPERKRSVKTVRFNANTPAPDAGVGIGFYYFILFFLLIRFRFSKTVRTALSRSTVYVRVATGAHTNRRRRCSRAMLTCRGFSTRNRWTLAVCEICRTAGPPSARARRSSAASNPATGGR